MKLFAPIEDWNKIHWLLFYLLLVLILIGGIYYHWELIKVINERRRLDIENEAYWRHIGAYRVIIQNKHL